jgi:hypothetical protein
MFDLFRGPHFTLLGFGADFREPHEEIAAAFGPAVSAYSVLKPGEDRRDSAAISDNEGHAHRAYGISESTQILIRPDGYIGLATQDRSATAVRAYLSEWALLYL